MGKRFAFPIKNKLPRAKRAKARSQRQSIKSLTAHVPSFSDDNSIVTPLVIVDKQPEDIEQTLTTVVGKLLCTNYQLHELPSDSGECFSDSFSTSISASPSEFSSQYDSALTSMSLTKQSNIEVLVNTALLARIESLEAENHVLKSSTTVFSVFV